MIRFSLVLFLWSFSVFASEIALTFDDAPRPHTIRFDGATRGEKLLENLRIAKVTRVAFFANTKDLDQEGKRRLQRYVLAGHVIGSHTHSHVDLNTTTTDEYITDISIADRELSALPGFTQWFRFPFLREGNSLQKRDFVRSKLLHMGYQNAYVTVNTYDWYMDAKFQEALEQHLTVNETALRDTYVSVLMDAIVFYDQMARAVLGRSPKHVILLHENDLAALYIGDLVSSLRSNGWKIISPDDAYTDPISHFVTSHLFPNNPGRIGEIAQSHGWKDDRQTLWHRACDKKFLDQKFIANRVFSEVIAKK